MALEDLLDVPTGSADRLAQFWMVPLDPGTGEPFPSEGEDMQPARLQYWPDTLSYNRGEVGWQAQPIPGLSHGLVSWSGGGNPTLNFDIHLSADRDPAYEPAGFDDVSLLEFAEPRNVNINAAVSYFKALTLPKYPRAQGSGLPVEPPPVVQVVPEFLPPDAALDEEVRPSQLGSSQIESLKGLNAFIGAFGETPTNARGVTLSHQPYRDFFGVVNDMSVEYNEFFISGAPKLATISVSLMEVIQLGDVILPHNRLDTYKIAKQYELVAA